LEQVLILVYVRFKLEVVVLQQQVVHLVLIQHHLVDQVMGPAALAILGPTPQLLTLAVVAAVVDKLVLDLADLVVVAVVELVAHQHRIL
jgi:hypothetical protein